MAGERFVINTITDILRKWGSPQEAARKLTRIADEAPNTLTQFQPPVVAEQLDRAGRGYDDIDSNLELSFDSPPTPNPILRVDSHEGRNRSRTMSDRGDLETLVSLGTRSGYPKEAAHIKELLRNPQTEIYSQPDTTGQNSMRVGPLSQLFRLLGLGGISSLPMLED